MGRVTKAKVQLGTGFAGSGLHEARRVTQMMSGAVVAPTETAMAWLEAALPPVGSSPSVDGVDSK